MDFNSDSSSGAGGDFQQQVMEEQQKAQFMQQLHHLNDNCWTLCVGSPSSSLSGREQSCLTNCVDRFVDTTLLITDRFTKLAQKMETIQKMTDARGGCVMVLKILTSSLGIIMGCVAFPVFTFLFGNIHAGLWALLSVIQASMVLHLHLLYKSYRLETWHTPHSLSACRDLGLLTMVGGLGATVYYVYSVVVYQEPMFPIRESSMIASVWAFMCVKWGLGLAFFGQKYKLVIDREYSLL